MTVLTRVQSVSPSSSHFAVEVSPVVHQGTPFYAILRLPASSTLSKKGGIDAHAYLVDKQGEETLLAKKKLSVITGGQVSLEHVLDDLRIR